MAQPQKKEDIVRLAQAWDEHASIGFSKLIADALEYGSVTEPVFSRLLSKAVNRYGITPAQLSDKFGVDPSTVSRWISGASVPHPGIRPIVLQWVHDRLYEEATSDDITDAERKAVAVRFTV